MTKLHTVYKTTNLVNGKYYFGVHKTENPYDEYLGSGKYLKRAVAKYGKEKFRKEVLFIYLDPESAFSKEDELIQCYRGLDPHCMNLRKGGSGGFDWINKNGFSSLGGKRGKQTQSQMFKTNAIYREKRIESAKQNLKLAHGHPNNVVHSKEARILGQVAGTKKWTGQKHSPASCEKMRKAQTGDGNSQFGTRWITNGISNKKVPKSTHVTDGWKPGRTLFRHSMEPPELMIWADPPGREPGTWLFRKGHEPQRIDETSEFERIWMGTIGITEVSIKRFTGA